MDNNYRDKDYYGDLELSPGASEVDIKDAYRRLAVIYHPDKNLGNPDATSKFQAIGEAYGVLNDPQKRAYYDWVRSSSDPQSAGYASGTSNMAESGPSYYGYGDDSNYVSAFSHYGYHEALNHVYTNDTVSTGSSGATLKTNGSRRSIRNKIVVGGATDTVIEYNGNRLEISGFHNIRDGVITGGTVKLNEEVIPSEDEESRVFHLSRMDLGVATEFGDRSEARNAERERKESESQGSSSQHGYKKLKEYEEYQDNSHGLSSHRRSTRS
jgi:curved DNA-binding protein CbpA